jgi:hypothetical protein
MQESAAKSFKARYIIYGTRILNTSIEVIDSQIIKRDVFEGIYQRDGYITVL